MLYINTFKNRRKKVATSPLEGWPKAGVAIHSII